MFIEHKWCEHLFLMKLLEIPYWLPWLWVGSVHLPLDSHTIVSFWSLTLTLGRFCPPATSLTHYSIILTSQCEAVFTHIEGCAAYISTVVQYNAMADGLWLFADDFWNIEVLSHKLGLDIRYISCWVDDTLQEIHEWAKWTSVFLSSIINKTWYTWWPTPPHVITLFSH